MSLLASEQIALDLILKAEEAAKAPYLAMVPLTPAQVEEMTKAVRLAGLRALFLHMTTVTVVAGSGGGPAPVVGVIT